MPPLPLIIDCDTGCDDAVALLLALRATEQFHILGICTVAGNVDLPKVSQNTRQICALLDRTQIPVYEGCAKPLQSPRHMAEDAHGVTGMGRCVLPAPQKKAETLHAVDFYIQTLEAAQEKVTIAITGPATNLAQALTQAPHIAKKIERIVIMAGSLTGGNMTLAAEFNVYCDPHATQILAQSGIPMIWITLDITHQVTTSPAWLAALQSAPNPIAQAYRDILIHGVNPDQENFGLAGNAIHDACVMAYLLHPALFTLKPAALHVITDEGPACGATLFNTYPVHTKNTPHHVAVTVNAAGVLQLIHDALDLQ